MGYKYTENISKIRNPSPIRRKIVQTLAEKLMATELPAVGLNKVKAFVPDSFAKDVEPYYECQVSEKTHLGSEYPKQNIMNLNFSGILTVQSN